MEREFDDLLIGLEIELGKNNFSKRVLIEETFFPPPQPSPPLPQNPPPLNIPFHPPTIPESSSNP